MYGLWLWVGPGNYFLHAGHVNCLSYELVQIVLNLDITIIRPGNLKYRSNSVLNHGISGMGKITSLGNH
jgi:hypothetical protein